MGLKTLLVSLGLAAAAAAAAAAPNNNDASSRSSSLGGSQHKRYLEERNGITYNIFQRDGGNTSLSYVENSGICETTAGVTTYSGYLDADPASSGDMHMWFWFFSARSGADAAPLVLWLNGGPGCSSMVGLFQEHGPCHFVDGAAEPSLNEHSWNNYANMLYVDQPIGTGFSYGTDDATSTVAAAPFVWEFLQNFYRAFPAFKSREFALFTESYGGHYGPEFADYFQRQNEAIDSGSVAGDKINLVALGINNGWIYPELQYQAYPEYALNNTYRQLINESQYEEYMTAYAEDCLPIYEGCKDVTGNTLACLQADSACAIAVESPIENANDFNVYNILQSQAEGSTDPPETYVDYLQNRTIMNAIGAQSTFSECANGPYAKIVASGDSARSFMGPLERVVQSGSVNVLIWAGDLDWICNWFGSDMVVNNLTYADAAEFQATALAEYTVEGVSHGQFKSVGKLNYLRVYEAGHEVPYYQPEVSLQVFTQILKGEQLTST